MATPLSTLEEQNVDVFKTKIDKITVSPLSKLKPNKHSYCWNYFGQLVVNIDGKKRTVLCDQIFCDECLRNAKERDLNLLFSGANVKAYSKNIATSNLLRHLKDEHRLEETQQKSKVAPLQTFFSVQRRPVKKLMTALIERTNLCLPATLLYGLQNPLCHLIA